MNWNKIFSVEKNTTHKIITILGLRIKIRRSIRPWIRHLLTQNEQIVCQLAYFKARDLFKQHYQITIPAECCGQGSFFELSKIKLKDIKRLWEDGKMYPLDQNPPYRYLQTRDPCVYNRYLDTMEDIGELGPKEIRWSVDIFRQLEESVASQGYDPSRCAIAVTEDNVLIDGLHRCSVLLQRYGPEHEILVVRVCKKARWDKSGN